jgi:acyl dehydratase
MPKRYFEDLTAGAVFDLPPVTITRETIVAFAREFDPQPFHIEEGNPSAGLTDGSLIASGWHVCAVFMRMLCDGLLLDSSCLGSPGIENLKWQRTVRPGDTLSGRSTVIGARASETRRERGIVRFRHEVFNQAGEPVMTLDNPIFFGRRSGP